MGLIGSNAGLLSNDSLLSATNYIVTEIDDIDFNTEEEHESSSFSYRMFIGATTTPDVFNKNWRGFHDT